MLAGDVVEDQVEHQADALAAQRGGELAQVVDGAEVRRDRPVVLDGVAAVVVALARLEQRHQVQVGDAEVLEVVEALRHALQVAGEPLGVAGVAEHPRLLQPVGREQPLLVEAVQVGGALGVRRGRGLHEPGQQRPATSGSGWISATAASRSGQYRSSRSANASPPVAG